MMTDRSIAEVRVVVMVWLPFGCRLVVVWLSLWLLRELRLFLEHGKKLIYLHLSMGGPRVSAFGYAPQAHNQRLKKTQKRPLYESFF
jgi:hypothetical protein